MILWKKAVVCLAFLVVLSSSVFAVEYSTEYPSYVPISGGAYIEVQSTLGRGSLVFPNQYQNNTFGFSGSGLNLCNITYSTVSGYFYSASGSPVQVRFQRYNTLEYYYENGSWGNEWRPVTISAIYNTNVRFIDNTTLTRAQEGPIFDDGQRTMIPLVIVLLLVAVIGICLGFRRK